MWGGSSILVYEHCCNRNHVFMLQLLPDPVRVEQV